jgi:hypothetical protein
VFGQMAFVGSSGCGFEQPLAAMRAALDDNPANAGFSRDEALLGIVFLIDEDDCSARDPALFSDDDGPLGPLQSFRCTRFGVTCGTGGQTADEMNQAGPKDLCGPSPSGLLDHPDVFHDFLLGLKGNDASLLLGGIIGTPEPVATELRTINGMQEPALAHSCSTLDQGSSVVADPGVRMQAFFDSFGTRSAVTTICQDDYRGVLGELATKIEAAFASSCVPALRDVSPEPGLQTDCSVEELLAEDVAVIEPCDASDTPVCWKLVEDAACPDLLRLDVTRAGEPDPATVTRMVCTRDDVKP